MPDRSAYDEAMRLSQARLKVPDSDLKQGKVDVMTTQTAMGKMERPWGAQGGFAVVYRFSCQSGKKRALRCFLVPMTPDIADRYQHISAYFAAHAASITVEFNYHDAGILIKENVYGQSQNKVYPLIEMEWVEGMTLCDYVDELCKKHDTATLADVVNQWVGIMQTMQKASISHGDLAGGNIMVRPGGQLVLVDYDGVYIPGFAGRDPVVLGQVDYQHPEMQLRPFNERTDDFSAWVIYVALLAMQLRPELWNKYMQHNAQGKLLENNLLFKGKDFVDPDQSPLFADLSQLNDPRLRKALQILRQACAGPVNRVPPFNPAIHDPDADKKQVLAKLEQAIQNNDDEAIVQVWTNKLENYPPAQQYAARVAQAKQVLQTLKRLQDALKTGSVQQIAAAYDPVINNCKQFTADQALPTLLALEFVVACSNNDDQAIVSAWEAIQDSPYKSALRLDGQEQQRLALAQRRKEALVRFRLALMNKRIQPIVSSYDPGLLDASTAVTAREREILRLAQDFAQACQNNDDQAIVASSEEIENYSYRADFVFTPQERQRIEAARQRKLALVKFRMSLMSKNIAQIIGSYDWILDDCASITQQERTILRLAKAFMQAIYKNDDHAIAAAWEQIQKSPYQQFFMLTPQEQQRLDTARAGQSALPKFRQALAGKNVQQIVASYDTALDGDGSITQQERNLLEVARDFVQAYQSNNDQALAAAWERLQEPPYQQAFVFSAQERQRAELAARRKAALLKFRLAIMNKRVQPIVAAYDPVLDGSASVTASERNLLALARQLAQAFQRDSDQAIVAAWTAIQHSSYQKSFLLTDAETQRLNRAMPGK